MKIQSINKNYSSSFMARLPKKEISNLISEAESTKINLPELYTLLKFLDKVPTTYLRFVKHKMINKNMLDNLSPGFTYFLVSKNEIMGQSSESKISALYDACVKNNLLYKKYASLSPSAYKTFCNNNKNVTEGDILQLSLES